ncbi:MAG: ribonuclease R [Candidatus Pacebacteria bacterium]|nr:ribonuclease R [Candidatus Paceibacterota bacterium]
MKGKNRSASHRQPDSRRNGPRNHHRLDSRESQSRFLVAQILSINHDGYIQAQILSGAKKSLSRLPEFIEISPTAGPSPKNNAAVSIGDRVFVNQKSRHEFEIMRILPQTAANSIGIFDKTPLGGKIRALEKSTQMVWLVAAEDCMSAQSGELVVYAPLSQHHEEEGAKVVERLGPYGSVASISVAVLRSLEIPLEFNLDIEQSAVQAAAKPIDLNNRTDFRHLPFVTIDGIDARDFDDAVVALADSDPNNPGGFCLWVAIADVSFFVTAESPLDLEARERGNSVYLPDRVIPMLPEALSNGACSLLPHQDRAVMVAVMRINAEGQLISREFKSGVINSRARLTYEQVQGVMDGEGAGGQEPQIKDLVSPLEAAFKILLAARELRHALDLELPEREVILDPTGQAVVAIANRQRLNAHRLIEELMILANVAAAEVLEQRLSPCIYRIHDSPSPEKFLALSQSLAAFGYKLAKGQVLRPELLVRILQKSAGKPEHDLIHGLILRSLALAVYSPDNIGHFGLSLRRYAHFTSPIRRYADLMVHRFLKQALKIEDHPSLSGQGGERVGNHAAIAQHISGMERRAVNAERGVKDRLLAAFMATLEGAEFTARVSSVTKFGLFVTLDETGADGLVPMSALPSDYYKHDPKTQRLVGDKSKKIFRLGDRLLLRLDEVDIVTGRLKFSFVQFVKEGLKN